MAVAKFPIIIAAVVAVMVALIVLPTGLNRQGEPTDQMQVDIDYTRRNLTRTADGVLAATNAEALAIKNDGSAEYSKVTPEGTSDRQSFSIGGQEMSRLKALFGNGFMQIPVTDYPQKEGLANFTKYTITVKVDGDSKTISWVNPEAYNGTIPPIIANAGSRLDAIIMSGRSG
jgi:hypothetical protein